MRESLNCRAMASNAVCGLATATADYANPNTLARHWNCGLI
jgi:hypothetical protein